MRKPHCIILDIEGTTSSITFVYDVMFPFVREHLRLFLSENWEQANVQDCLALLAQDVGELSVDAWLDADVLVAQKQVAQAVTKLMDDDVKATGLKKLQGAIWKKGFESGQMVAHVYDDVEPSIRRWKDDGIDIRIYSSGSIEAQQLFFGHCLAGDLLDLFSGHYDTTIGSKKESSSYQAIAEDAGVRANDCLFVSDVSAELEAAHTAGMQTLLSVRAGNRPEPDWPGQRVNDFSEIDFEVSV